jgi:hypothetical protein
MVERDVQVQVTQITKEGRDAMQAFADASKEAFATGIYSPQTKQVLATARAVIEKAPGTHSARTAQRYVGHFGPIIESLQD